MRKKLNLKLVSRSHFF